MQKPSEQTPRAFHQHGSAEEAGIEYWNNDLVVKALDSQSRDSMFKITRWLQGRINLSEVD